MAKILTKDSKDNKGKFCSAVQNIYTAVQNIYSTVQNIYPTV